jgi:hypothetical protein
VVEQVVHERGEARAHAWTFVRAQRRRPSGRGNDQGQPVMPFAEPLGGAEEDREPDGLLSEGRP